LEEVEYLLEQQVVMAEAAEKLPDSLPLQRQAQDNMVLLRKSLHVWGEKTKALAARPAEPRTLSNEQELAVRRTHNAIVAQIQLHTANGYRAKIPIEGLKDSPELKELEKQVDNLVKLFIEPEEDFGTKKPMWKPKSVLDLDDRDKGMIHLPEVNIANHLHQQTLCRKRPPEPRSLTRTTGTLVSRNRPSSIMVALALWVGSMPVCRRRQTSVG
jgi:hypothetical protein